MINILGLPRYVETKRTFLFPAYTNMKMGSISLKEILKLYCQSMIESIYISSKCIILVYVDFSLKYVKIKTPGYFKAFSIPKLRKVYYDKLKKKLKNE